MADLQALPTSGVECSNLGSRGVHVSEVEGGCTFRTFQTFYDKLFT